MMSISEKQKKPPIQSVVFRNMVGRVGFEPTTNWLKANCSTN